MSQFEIDARCERAAANEIYKTSRVFLDTLTRLRPLFNNDLDQLAIYLVFLLGPLHKAAAGGGGERSQGMNALSIAQITRIARELTRRKLRSLQAAELIEQGPDGLWRLGDRFGVEGLEAELLPLMSVLAKLNGATSAPHAAAESRAMVWERRAA